MKTKDLIRADGKSITLNPEAVAYLVRNDVHAKSTVIVLVGGAEVEVQGNFDSVRASLERA